MSVYFTILNLKNSKFGFFRTRLFIGMVLFLFIETPDIFAQPVNDDLDNAIELNITFDRNYINYSTLFASGSSEAPMPTCGDYQGADAWFEVEVPASGSLQIDITASDNPKYVMAIYIEEDDDDYQQIACSEVGSNDGASSRITFNNSEYGGEDIFIRVFRKGSTSGGQFQLSAYKNFATVSNDEPSGAIALSNEKNTFERQTFSTEPGTPSSSIPIASCHNKLTKDIWFTATIPTSGKLIVETEPIDVHTVVSIYTGTASNLIEYDCSRSGTTDSGGEVLIDSSSMANQNVFIRVHSKNNKVGGEFSIVILEPKQDVCSDAILLDDISTIEKYTTYTNQFASPANDGTEPTCATFMDKDIWFKIKMPSNGELVLDSKVDELSGIMPVFTVYTGTCGNLSEYACNFWGSSNPFGAKISISDNSIANEYLYIRMFGYNDDIGGAFKMATIQPAVLPVELVRFRADVMNNEEVLLEWLTASELNNDYFIIEHSINGMDYTPVGHVDGRGTTNEQQSYLYKHTEPFFGENYYRLKQVDIDGDFEYSKVVNAVIEMKETKVIVYPNPTYVQEGISVRWIGDFGREAIQIAITDSSGKEVYRESVSVKSQHQTKIELSELGLNAGIYYLTVNDENSLITHQKINLVRE